jgi:hypothetical protein
MRHNSTILLIVGLLAVPAGARGLDGGDQLLPRLPQSRVKPGNPGLRDSLGQSQDDPLAKITESMSAVVTDLSKDQTDKPVQDKQGKILKDLDAVIHELEQQAGGGGGGKSGKNGNKGMTSRPSSPMKDSNIVGGPGGEGDLNAPKASRKEWAELPPKQRERILQATTEGFPPGFEAVLQSYYRRLAEERVVDDEGMKPTPTPAPNPGPADKPATSAPAAP